MNQRQKFRLLGIIFSLVILIVFVASIIKRAEISGFINEKIETSGSVLLFIISGLSEILPQYIGPHAILLHSILIGVPKLTALIIIALGSTCGSLLGFEISRKYGLPWALKFYNYEKIQSIETKIDKHGKWLILIAAVTPAPYLPIVFGALGIKRKTLIFFGIIPRIIGLVLISLLINSNWF